LLEVFRSQKRVREDYSLLSYLIRLLWVFFGQPGGKGIFFYPQISFPQEKTHCPGKKQNNYQAGDINDK
jgi:hypothetical protein